MLQHVATTTCLGHQQLDDVTTSVVQHLVGPWSCTPTNATAEAPEQVIRNNPGTSRAEVAGGDVGPAGPSGGRCEARTKRAQVGGAETIVSSVPSPTATCVVNLI